jgi:DNA invertase Pin-like site-specific DNA recombinase
VIKEECMEDYSKSEIQNKESDLSIFGVKKACEKAYSSIQKNMKNGDADRIKEKLREFKKTNDIEIHFDDLQSVSDNANLFYVCDGIDKIQL